jgi:hypothetical protein
VRRRLVGVIPGPSQARAVREKGHMPGVIPTFYPIVPTASTNRVVAISQIEYGRGGETHCDWHTCAGAVGRSRTKRVRHECQIPSRGLMGFHFIVRVPSTFGRWLTPTSNGNGYWRFNWGMRRHPLPEPRSLSIPWRLLQRRSSIRGSRSQSPGPDARIYRGICAIR